MTKTLNKVFNDEDFYKIQEIKNRSGLSWDVFIIKSAEAYAREMMNNELIEGE